MLRSFLTLLLLCVALDALAHPGVGIVVDDDGTVFYTDLQHVWRVDPNGRKSIAVRDVHTHELYLDGNGALYGEDNRYLGNDRYRHRIWRRAPNGNVTDVVPWTDGFWRDYGFTRDGSGTMYWLRESSLYQRTPEGRVSKLATFRGHVNWIVAREDGSVIVAEHGDLKLVGRYGRVETLARFVGRGRGRHATLGMALGERGSVYVAVPDARAIVRVTDDGRKETVARTRPPWRPSGVAFGPNGEMWILEYASSERVRARRVQH